MHTALGRITALLIAMRQLILARYRLAIFGLFTILVPVTVTVATAHSIPLALSLGGFWAVPLVIVRLGSIASYAGWKAPWRFFADFGRHLFSAGLLASLMALTVIGFSLQISAAGIVFGIILSLLAWLILIAPDSRTAVNQTSRASPA